MALEGIGEVVAPKRDCIISKQTAVGPIQISEGKRAFHPCNDSREPCDRRTVSDDLKGLAEIAAGETPTHVDYTGRAGFPGKSRELRVENVQHGNGGLLGVEPS